jgi:hypothetical protein
MTTHNGDETSGLARVWIVLERLAADDVHGICADLTAGTMSELARVVDVPRVALSRNPSAARVLRHRIRRNQTRANLAVDVLVRPTRDLAIAALGPERSETPSEDDLVEVLPALLERDGPRRVALLLAYAVDDGWAAAEPSRRILDTDAGFTPDALGPPIDDDAPPPVTRVPADRPPPTRDRAPRTKKKPRPKPAAQAGRPSYKRKRPADASGAPDEPRLAAAGDGPPPAITVNGRALDANAHHRRDVRVVGSYRALDRADPLVGRVVLAEVVFDGPVPGGKVRPCVVIAASGVHDLVVRPCYSEGARRAGDFRAVPLTDVDEAGLDKTSFVSHEERCIPRTAVAMELGWLSVTDWNQL